MLAFFFAINLVLELLRLRQYSLTYALATVVVFALLLLLQRGGLKVLTPSLLLGSATALACMVDPQLLWVLTNLCLLLLCMSREQRLDLDWAAPFLIVLLCWTTAKISIGIDPQEIRAVLFPPSSTPLSAFQHLYLWFSISAPDWILAFQGLSHFLMLVALISAFSQDLLERSAFIRGLSFTLPISLGLNLLQIFWRDAPIFPNQNAYWSSLERLSGTFSDPNGFGVFSFLLLGALFVPQIRSDSLKRVGTLIFNAAWFSAALYSGSRSLVLGLVLLVAWAVFSYSKRAFTVISITAAVLLMVFNFLPQGDLLVAALPSALRRSLDTLHFSHLSEAFFSRVVFFKAGLQIWLDHYLVGAGLGSFRELFPLYAQTLNLGTELWSDNSNNFYLGILAELGVVGLAALIWSVLRLRRVYDQENQLGLTVLLIFGVLLCLGPHLDFAEVAVLAAWLTATYFKPDSSAKIGLAWIAPAILVALVIFYTYQFSERGLYALERAGDGRAVRWSARRAQLLLPCDGAQAKVELAAFQPDLSSSSSICVKLRSAASLEQRYCFEQPGWHSFEFACPPRSIADPKAGPVLQIAVSLECSNVWVPAERGIGSDRRALGVMVSIQVNSQGGNYSN